MKKYEHFLIENISLSNDILIDILIDLKKTKKHKTINKIINQTDNKGNTIFMNVVKSKNIDLIKFLLDFDIDINKKNKKGENALYFAKNVKTINLLLDNNIDIISTKENPILVHLSKRNLFHKKLYEKAINNNITKLDEHDKHYSTVFSSYIGNYKIISFLSSFNVKLDNKNILEIIFSQLIYKYKYLNISLTPFKLLLKKEIIKTNCSFFEQVKTLFNNYIGSPLKEFIYEIKDIISYKDFVFLDQYNNEYIKSYDKKLHDLLDEIYDDDVFAFINKINKENMFYRSCSYDDFKKRQMIKTKNKYKI